MIAIPKIDITNRGLECCSFYLDNIETSLSQLINIENAFIIIVDFAIVKFSIIEEILKRGVFHEREDKNDKSNAYDIKSNYIKLYRTSKKCLILCCYENKFLQDFDTYEKAKELERFDIYKQPTCTKDAKKQLLKTISRNPNFFAQDKIFKKIFPMESGNEFNFLKLCKNSVIALYYREVGEFENVFSYDIKSSFPSRIYNGFLPSGNGHKFTGDLKMPSKYWYVVKISVLSYSVKYYDFLGFDNIEKDEGGFKYYCTKEILEMINATYDVKYIVEYGYWYKLRKTIFDKFFNDNFFNVENNKKHIRKYNKAKNNLIIGNFGKNDRIVSVRFSINEDKIVQSQENIELENKEYYPVYLYVNGLAKLEILKIVLKNFNDIIYINTDGFFSKKEINFSFYNILKVNGIGCVEFRNFYNKICIKDISNYFCYYVDNDGVIHNDYRLSGRKTNVDDYEDFKSGNFKSIIYKLSSYGFLTVGEYGEKSLDEYIEYDIYKENIKKLYKYGFLSIKNKDKYKKFLKDEERMDNLKLIEEIYNSLEKDDFIEEVNDSTLDLKFQIKAYKCKIDFSFMDRRYKKYDIILENELNKTQIKELLKNKYIKEI